MREPSASHDTVSSEFYDYPPSPNAGAGPFDSMTSMDTGKQAVRATSPFTSVRHLRRAALIALVLMTACVALALPACQKTDETPAAYTSPYDWAGLERTGDHLAYYEDGNLRSQMGVDVSSHQGSIDWQAVADDGIDFAIVRVGNRGYTEGALSVDELFTQNIDGAAAAGLETGVYFFSQALSADEAREEADLVLDELAGRKVDLPIAYDHESVADPAGRANQLTREDLAACARAFCERLEAAGYETMVYGNKQDIARFKGDTLGDRPRWLAEYDVAAPTAQFDFTIWQYTNDGSIAGIDTAVDLDIRFLIE